MIKTSQNEQYSNWRQCTYEEITKVGHEFPLPYQNGVVILIK